MRSLSPVTALVFTLLMSAAFSHSGCSEPPYLGGECEVNDDCTSEYQNVPGTGCIDGKCGCLDPLEHICCARGDTSRDCFLSCRQCSECAIGTPGCPVGCQSDGECQGPPDPRCGSGKCVQGACTVEIHPGPLASQIRGDCQRAECSVTGELVLLQDPSDFYDDGEQCTYDACGSQGPTNDALANNAICPVAGAGQCYDGRCVECYELDPNMNDCPPGSGLVCRLTQCVPPHCANGQPDPGLGETSVDCGGSCVGCYIGFPCQVGADCQSGVCVGNLCKAPTCSDGVKNDSETGIDCGAPSCPLCPPGQGCATGDDCTSGVCWAGLCQEPSCFDGVRSGGEAGIDCGGPCPACP